MASGSVAHVLPPEARWLLGTVGEVGHAGGAGNGRGADPADVDTVSRESLDWEALHQLIVRERAAAALHPIPDRVGIEVPSPWHDRLRALGAVAGFRQQRLLESLEDVAGRLAGHGVRIALLKGAALALTWYDHPLQRPMGDLDLLVLDGRAAEAWEILRDAGWIWHRERFPMELYDPRPHLPPLQDPGRTGRVVEVHDDLFIRGRPFEFGPRELLAGAGTRECGAARVRVPGPAAHLVYTCIHFAWSHCLAKWGWRAFRDAAVLTAAPAFRWNEFEALARSSGARRPCYWTLRLARELGGVPVPGRVLSDLRPDGLPRFVLRALERHFALELFAPGGGCPSVSLGQTMWRAAMAPGRPGPESAFPWAYDRGFVELERERSGGTPPSLPERLLRHGGDVRGWLRYLRGVAAV